MSITPLGGVFALLLVMAAASPSPDARARTKRVGVAAAISFPFYDSAALTIGPFGVAPHYLGIIALILLAATFRSPGTPTTRGEVLCLLLAGISVLTTAASPWLFSGLSVLASGTGLDEQVRFQSQLTYSASNVAQVMYLAVNLILVTFVLKRLGIGRDVIRVALTTGTFAGGMAAAATLLGANYPHELFDTNPRFFYAELDTRLRGHLSEPSHLGAFSLTALAFFTVSALTQSSAGNRLRDILMASVAALTLYLSEAGTAVLGAAVGGSLLLAAATIRTLSTGRLSLPGFVAISLGTGIALFLSQPGYDFVSNILASKQGSMSLTTRSFADLHALELTAQTYGLGVGLGSNRASSMLAMLASTIGVVGVCTFVGLCYLALRNGMRARNLAEMAALTALLTASFISIADFTSPILWTLIGTGLHANAGLDHTRGRTGGAIADRGSPIGHRDRLSAAQRATRRTD
ncbi:hypothetical protein [Nocardioides solisilvae]|uniref:hypothetical protein n=1 Tax=Nocardioides solisilvae TaxID=1542435 RepID=UPI0013A533A2|nr:hypothetical protein [Nocardioides solisilvae]